MLFINLHTGTDGHRLGDGETYDSLAEAQQAAAYFSDYLCTLELTDDGLYIQRHDDLEAVEMIRCERRFDNQEIEDCECGQHTLLPAEPDVGIMHSYLEA